MVAILGAVGLFCLQYAGVKALDKGTGDFATFIANRKPDPNHHLEKAIVEAHFRALGDVINLAVKNHGLPEHGVAAPHNARGQIDAKKIEFTSATKAKGALDEAMKESKLLAVANTLASGWRDVIPATFPDAEGVFAMPKHYVDAAVAELKGLAEWDDNEWASLRRQFGTSTMAGRTVFVCACTRP